MLCSYIFRVISTDSEPPSFLKPISDVEAIKHTCVKFTACITGIPMPSVEWFKNGQKMYNSDRVQQLNEAFGMCYINKFLFRMI